MDIVLFAAGNDARGDDALGPLLAARVRALRFPGVTVVEDFQFQVEHALDLPDEGLVLFVDAHCRQSEPLSFGSVEVASRCAPGSHQLSPGEVLAVARRIGRPLPSAWLLSLRGRSFGLGDALSASGRLALAAGWGCLRALLARPRVSDWRVAAQSWGSTAGPRRSETAAPDPT